MTTLSPLRRVILVVGGFLSLGVIALAVLSLVDAMGRTSRHEVVRVDQQALAGKKLTIHGGAGDIRLVGTKDSKVTIQADMAYGLIRPTTLAIPMQDGFRLESHCDSWLPFSQCRVSYRIDVPEDFTVNVVGSWGDVNAEGLVRGKLTVHSSAGDVVADNVTDTKLDLTTTAGDIAGMNLSTADVTANSSAGDVDLNFDTPPMRVDAHSSAGDVNIGVPDNGYETHYVITTSTTAGDSEVDTNLQGASERTINATSSAGDINVRPKPPADRTPSNGQ
jgi:hypothetical protein